MIRPPYRLFFAASLLAIFLILDSFTSLNRKTTLAITIILLFLLLFTYVFTTEASKMLNIFIILFSFIGLPLFMLHYMGILNSLSNPLGRIIISLIFAFFGFLAILTIVKLNFVEIEYGGNER